MGVASTERNVARLLTGPPRVAPFLADLDPTTGTGRIFANAAADQYTVTWCNVRGFDLTQTTSVQTTLLPDGTIEMKFAGNITLGEAIDPGRHDVVAAVLPPPREVAGHRRLPHAAEAGERPAPTE